MNYLDIADINKNMEKHKTEWVDEWCSKCGKDDKGMKKRLTKAQFEYSMEYYGKRLCFNHQW